MTTYIYGKKYIGLSSAAANAKALYDVQAIEITPKHPLKKSGPIVLLSIRSEEIELTRHKALQLIEQLKKCL